MGRILLFYISWALSVAVVIGCVLWSCRKEHRKNAKVLIFVNTLGFGIAVFLIRFGVLFSVGDSFGKTSGFVRSVGNAIIHTLQTFSLDESYDLFLEAEYLVPRSAGHPEWVTTIYTVYLVFLNVAAPLLTIAFLLSLLEELLSRLKAMLHPFRKKVLFSELNEATLTLAEDIRRKERKTLLIFAEAGNREDDEKRNELRDRARLLGAVLAKSDLSALRFANADHVPVTYVLGSREENKNLKEAARLSKNGGKAGFSDLSDVYVLEDDARSEETLQQIIAGRENENMRFFPVNVCRNTAERLFLTHPLFERFVAGEKNTLTVLLIASGKIGTELLKTALWCGQVPDVRLRVAVISEDALTEEAYFRRDCPGFFEGDCYDLSFAEMDVRSRVFEDRIRSDWPDADYVVVALEDEELNFGTASELERIYNRIHLSAGTAPEIFYRVGDENLFRSVISKTGKTVSRRECVVTPFGNDGEAYSEENVFHSDLDRGGLAVHFSYSRLALSLPEETREKVRREFKSGHVLSRIRRGENGCARRYEEQLFRSVFTERAGVRHGLWRILAFLKGRPGFSTELLETLSQREQAVRSYYESVYGQRSSRASALHLFYKVRMPALFGEDAGTEPEEAYESWIRDPEKKTLVSKTEHLRWNAFMHAQGYTCPDEETFASYAFMDGNDHRQDPLRLHPCLVDWEELDRVNEMVGRYKKERTGADESHDFKTDDEVIVLNAAKILKTIRDGRKIV